ncbi:MAG: DUF3520 domain-containing protein [Planctomycetota bacterium]|nr:MAG: DUF3520 domain-containing protein [Planctomycetota bacterium]
MTRSEDPHRLPPTGLEARLTARLLGELTPDEAAEIDRAVAADPALQNRRAELEAVITALRASTSGAPRLGAERRAELRRAAAVGGRRRGGLLRLPAALKWAAALAAVAGASWWAGDRALRGPAAASGEEAAVAAPAAPTPDRDRSPAAGARFLRPGDSVPPPPPAETRRGRREAVVADRKSHRQAAARPRSFASGGGAEAAAAAQPEALRPAAAGTAADRLGRLSVVDGYGRRWTGEAVFRHYLRRLPDERPRDLFFRFYGDNPAVAAAEEPVSSFAADVDTAGYGLCRGYLLDGFLPPKEAVRTEEFVNSFRHGLAPPSEGDFALDLALTPSPFSGGDRTMLRVGLKAREVSPPARRPLNLVFVIDRRGPMADGGRIELVRRALERLVDQLRDDDTVGVVAFEERAPLVLEPTPGSERRRIREALRSLETGGSTLAEAGLLLGYELAERAYRAGAVNRVVLCSDGVANTGGTDQSRILARIRTGAARDIDLTAIAVGVGDHNDVFLERLADEGDGSCHYVDDFAEAERVLVEGFTGVLPTIAREVKVQVEFNPEAVRTWRQLGYENRAPAGTDFRNDAADAGEIGAGQEVVALYEIEARSEAAGDPWLARVRLRWLPDGSDRAVELAGELRRSQGWSRFEMAPPRLRLALVAAQFAEVLRRSFWARGDSFDRLREEAARLARELPADPQVLELRDLIERTRALIPTREAEDPISNLLEEARRLRLLEAEAAAGAGAEAEADLEEIHRRSAEIEARLREAMGG